MLEIIPNWHPIFVHFTVGLFSLAVGLFVIAPFMRPPLREQWLLVARWVLWFGAGITVLTGLTGLYAYNTVAHDTPSHIAMTDHRNWAIATMSAFFMLTVVSIVRQRAQQPLGKVFIVFVFLAGGLLLSTAWHGGEVVYRYGLGVMSLPESNGEGHAHEHPGGGHSDAGHGHDGAGPDDMMMDDMDMGSMGDDHHHDDGSAHAH